MADKSSYCKQRKHKKCRGCGCECHIPEQAQDPSTQDPNQDVKPAPKDGPNLTIRMRSNAAIDRVKKAASKTGLSMNTWAVEVLERAAEAQVS